MKNVIFFSLLLSFLAINLQAQTVAKEADLVQVFVTDKYKLTDEDGTVDVKANIRIVQGQKFIVIENRTDLLTQLFTYDGIKKDSKPTTYIFSNDNGTVYAYYTGYKNRTICIKEVPTDGASFIYNAELVATTIPNK